MAAHDQTQFLAGVIEGFYGQPWLQAERMKLFDQMAAWDLNTYLYAPKDDLKHRAIWRELYSAAEAETLDEIIRACQQRKIRFIYALSPGLNIRYSDDVELDHLRNRLEQMLSLGCEHFALLFDDIPDRMAAEDQKRWGSFASAQCYVTNAVFKWVCERCPQARFLFCPTPYCGRMAERNYGGEGYLATVGRELLPVIDVFWTGPEIISQEITVAHVEQLQTVLRRKPLIWDNLHANDYDGRRFYCGPYAGRPPELRGAVAGLLTNPNCEFPLNYVPIRTLAEFVHCRGSWDARKAYLSAMREWLPRFAAIGEPVRLEDLESFGDCFYLPHEDGADAERLLAQFSDLLSTHPSQWGERVTHFRNHAARLRNFCARMAELKDRSLFYALSRRVWELREELDLLDRFVDFKSNPGNADAPFTSDFHLPGTYRGGFVARLQRLLGQKPDGSFVSAQDNHHDSRLTGATP
jgi:protein O-GlcNAcase/histone acetyltransferase